MHRIVHFEFHSTDPTRDMKFFGDVFGWKFEKFGGSSEDMPYYLTTTGPQGEMGINGGIMKSPDGKPRTINTLQVENVDKSAEKVTAHGGQIIMPKMPIPGVGYVIYCTDPGGQMFGIFQMDSSVKKP